jgi:glycosyltransferase involved in cell wall biosynthesis
MTRVALIFTNYGPYHLARSRALTVSSDLDLTFIELASKERLYPWVVDDKSIPLITLSEGHYEDAPKKELIAKLFRTLSVIDPDVVITAGYRELPMWAASVWTRVKRRACVMMFATTEGDRRRSWWKEYLKRQFIRTSFDAAICGGKAPRQYLNRLGMPDSRIWDKYNVVDNDHLSREAEKARERTDELRLQFGLPQNYFLFVGRFSEEKNILRLLGAYRAYKDAMPHGWGLVLVGDGLQREQLKATAKRLNLSDVVWPGFKQADELPRFYALGGALVLPSTREPWGLVVNEAMACGVPVLVSKRCGCSADLVGEGKNGYTFDPEDEGEITQCMLRLSSQNKSTLKAMGVWFHRQ